MMKNNIIHSIVLALAISSFATVIPKEAPSAWQKTKSFLKKHRSKIAAGVTAAAIIGLTIGLAYHGNRTMKAIEAAGITPSDEEFMIAIEYVGLLGPLGPTRATALILKAKDLGYLSSNDVGAIATSKIGTALCKYWGITQFKFVGNLGFSLVKQKIEPYHKALKEGVNQLKNLIRKK